MIAARPWLRVFQLPGHAPELNPAENVWSNLRRSLVNYAAANVTALAQAARTKTSTLSVPPRTLSRRPGHAGPQASATTTPAAPASRWSTYREG
uniref:hypothetical protein n=1 Tax=Allocatelliglobosispora scoriae TaxID=643052 RepID=UPI0035E43D2A